MAVAIHVYIVSKDGKFSGVEHVFYGRTEAEADAIRLEHMAGCTNYSQAEVTERAFEASEEIALHDIPDPEDFAAEEEEEGEEGEEEEEEEEKGK